MNLERANSGSLGDGSPPAWSRGGAPVGGLGTKSPEADDFSQLKGYLDVTSGILREGEACPLCPPLKSASGPNFYSAGSQSSHQLNPALNI